MASVQVYLTVDLDAELEDGTFEDFECHKLFSMPFCPWVGLRVELGGLADYVDIVAVSWNLASGLVECFARIPGLDMPIYDRDVWSELKTELLKAGWSEVK